MNQFEKCPYCGGEGCDETARPQHDDPYFAVATKCEECNGSGWVDGYDAPSKVDFSAIKEGDKVVLVGTVVRSSASDDFGQRDGFQVQFSTHLPWTQIRESFKREVVIGHITVARLGGCDCCDCCGASEVGVSRVWAHGIETFACSECLGDDEDQEVFIHIQPKIDACEHDFQGWRDFEDGNGGEQICTKCGMGAMAHSLQSDF